MGSRLSRIIGRTFRRRRVHPISAEDTLDVSQNPPSGTTAIRAWDNQSKSNRCIEDDRNQPVERSDASPTVWETDRTESETRDIAISDPPISPHVCISAQMPSSAPGPVSLPAGHVHPSNKSEVSSQICKNIFERLMPRQSEKYTMENVRSILDMWGAHASGRLAEMEASVKSIPPCSTSTIPNLVSALNNLGPLNSTEDHIALAYKVYCWVATNISYDSEAKDTDPKVVLRTKRALCHGYATLFLALAEGVGLSVKRVVGNNCRQWLLHPGTRFVPQESNSHTWNVVTVDNVMFQVDCTFGSGSSIDGKFKHKFNRLYFFPPPEQLILTHWVPDERLQLLEYPVSLSDLQQLISPSLETLSKGILPDIFAQFIELKPTTHTTEVHVKCNTDLVITASVHDPIKN